jgi:hypothetical protein
VPLTKEEVQVTKEPYVKEEVVPKKTPVTETEVFDLCWDWTRIDHDSGTHYDRVLVGQAGTVWTGK